MMHCRYSGIFYSIAGVKWEARIMQDSDVAFATIGELSFPADSPLSIEWSETSKEEVMCGSVATLKILSPGDRTYIDLYTIAVGGIRLDVIRDNALYWSGALDPEFYEEPYSRVKDYEVTLTFSDFGILNRLVYGLSGLQKLADIIDVSLELSGINYISVDSSLISLTLLSQPGGPLQLSIDSANFFDEDGVPNTYKEVLEGILQPLTLRMIQRKGKIWIYDLHALYTSASSSQIQWASDDQMIGVDKVYNKVVVTFSPYSDPAKIDTEIKYTDFIDLNRSINDFQYLNGWVKNFDRSQERLVYLSLTGESGLAYTWGRLYYLHGVRLLQGDELNCLAYSVGACMDYGDYHHPGGNISSQRFTELMRTFKVCMPSADASKWSLRLQQDILVDVSLYGENDYAKDIFNQKVNYLMIPCRVRLYDDDGNVIYHYENRGRAANTDKVYLNNSLDANGRNCWEAGDYLNIDDKYDSQCYAWLEWYNIGDISGNAAIGGWKTNRYTIGLPTDVSPDGPMKETPAGEYIPYPPAGGYLEVTIYEGLWSYKMGETVFGVTPAADASPANNYQNIYELFNYILYKTPRVSIVRNYIGYPEVDSDDVIFNARLNDNAANEISIDTMCGTNVDGNPSARGAFILSNGNMLDSYCIRSSKPYGYKKIEKVLIDTIYSQFAARKTKLTGSVDLLADGVISYAEFMQQNKKFVLLADVQDVREDVSVATLVEVRPDEYNERS